jgi:predicted PurR-regulated permease PerM
MMGAIVVALAAALCMLLAGAVIAALRLVGAVKQLIAALDGVRRQLQPMVSELQENAEIASLEVGQLQSSVDSLRASRREGRR